MQRRDFLKTASLSLASLALSSCARAASDKKSTRPNILWLSCEDISPHLGCYGETLAHTPNLDAFARTGIRYDRAFTVHGVCSPSRTGIITGMYPSSLGANHHRSHAGSKAPVPDFLRCFPEYLRDAGYYCTNNVKEDYNFKRSPDAWDESSNKAHWKNRPADTPFFAVFNFVETHESRLWNSKDFDNTHPEPLTQDQWQDPDKMKVWPFYPDTPPVRKDFARLFERITQWDYFVKDRLDELEQAGLLDDTIVFVWSDHGTALPRGKRWTYDTGTLSVLMARVPEKFRLPGQAVPGSGDSSLVNFIDLGPTVLNLAGLTIPAYMHGQPFLGPHLPSPRKYIFGARDRIDEGHDVVRSVRTDRYRYVRHYMPFLPRILRLDYSLKCNTLQELIRLHEQHALPPAAEKLMEMSRDPEELFDLENDPYEMNNLADDPDHQAIKRELHAVLNNWLLDIRDTGFIPEPDLHRRTAEFPSFYAILHAPDGKALLEKLIDTADTAALASDRSTLHQRAKDSDPAVRYWAVFGIGHLPQQSAQDLAVLDNACDDPIASVRLAGAWCLFDAGRADRALETTLKDVEHPESKYSQHLAFEVLEHAGRAAAPALPRLQAVRPSVDYLFAKNVLDRVIKALQSPA